MVISLYCGQHQTGWVPGFGWYWQWQQY